VDALMETSILKVGDSVRINIQLIQVFPEERHLWAKTFDFHTNRSVLGVFNEFTHAVVDDIHLKLFPEQQALILASIKVDPEAYKAYLKGKYYQEQLSKEGFDLALEFFQQSIALDSTFAPVYNELATTYMYMLQMRKVPINEAFPKIYKYNNMALELDPNLDDAIFTKAVMSWFEWDWKSCEKSFQKVIDQNPNHVMANAFYGHLWMLNDRFDLAIPYMEKAVELDPKNDMVLSLYGVVLAHKGEVDKAIQIGEESMKLNPWNILTLRLLEFGSYQKGDLERSIQLLGIIYNQVFQIELDLNLEYKLHGYNAALEKLTKLVEESIKNQDLYIAMYQNRMGNSEKAIEWIEKGFGNHDVDVPYMFRDQSMKNLMSDPRIISISKKIQLPI
jgi:tetratricopeptide (TPR) repeat protein